MDTGLAALVCFIGGFVLAAIWAFGGHISDWNLLAAITFAWGLGFVFDHLPPIQRP